MKTITLTRGYVALVDDDVYARLNGFKWRAHGRTPLIYGYSTRLGLLHRAVLDETPPAGMHVDHINGNTLDNRRSNLRVVTPADNIRNQRRSHPNTSSRFLNVYFRDRSKQARSNCWDFQLKVNGNRIRKKFRTEIAAAHYAAQIRNQHGLPPDEQYVKEFGCYSKNPIK